MRKIRSLIFAAMYYSKLSYDEKKDLIDILTYVRDSLEVSRGSDFSGTLALNTAINILKGVLLGNECDR